MMAESTPRRQVRSYVRREGRMTRAQQDALARHWAEYGINYTPALLDPDKAFGRRGAPLVLDIGPGMGITTAALAQACPAKNYLAVEVHKPGIGSLLRLAAKHNLGNIRVISHDAVDVIRYMLPDNMLTEALIFFPDPWPKKRHHKRRLLNPRFAGLLLPKLKEHGRVYISTDWEDYAESIPAVFEQTGYVNLAGKNRRSPRPHWRPATKFEQRGMKLGHAAYDYIFARSNIYG
jgi:tRNA (guanine-N7-)-methyltransferase